LVREVRDMHDEQPSVNPPGRAPEVETFIGRDAVPEAIRSLSTVDDPEYVDAFTLSTSLARDASAEGWARAVLEESPLARRSARRLWSLMGLRLGPPHSPDFVQGWRIADRGDGWIRGETSSWYLEAQLVCLVEEGRVSLSLSLRYRQRLVGLLVWALVVHPHQRAVPVMLHQAAKVVGATAASS
jgi:hypothetical protein